MPAKKMPVFLTGETRLVCMLPTGPRFVRVTHDADCPDPRRAWENVGRIVTWSRRYRSPDGDLSLEEVAEECGIDDFVEGDPDEVPWWDGRENPVVAVARRACELGSARALVVSAYDHSGVTYRCGPPTQFCDSRWDAAVAGIAYADLATAAKAMGAEGLDPERLAARVDEELSREVDTWSHWAAGDTWRVEAFDAEANLMETYDGGLIGEDVTDTGIADLLGPRMAETDVEDEFEFAELVGAAWLSRADDDDFANRMDALARERPKLASRPIWREGY